MAPTIFLTGGTGYVGGTVLQTLIESHPEYQITVLLRCEPPGFSKTYPGVKVLKGTFDDTSILTSAAVEADIVVHHGNSDHLAAVKALIEGRIARVRAGLPAFYIHLGGTGIIAEVEQQTLGHLSDKVWSDIHDIDKLWSLPLDKVHRETESIIHEAWALYGDKLKTAVVCPPNIHGIGRGPGNVQSFYVPVFCDESLKKKSTFYLNEGSNIYARTHVENVAEIFLRLVESAVDGGNGADWNREGYYFVPAEHISQLEIAIATGKILHAKGVIESEKPKQITLEELDRMVTYVQLPGTARLIFASNSRSTADRARKVFGIQGHGSKFFESLEADLDQALKGLKKVQKDS